MLRIRNRLRRALFAKQFEALHLGKLTYNLHQIGFTGLIFPDGSAANAGLLYTLLRVLWQTRPESVLELGSGLTTELIHHYLRLHEPTRAVSLEENPDWHRRVAERLTSERHRYLHRPLQGSPPFYDMTGIDGPFDLVLIDGPVADRRGTIGAVPARLASRFVIIVDDVHKSNERSGYRFAMALRAAIHAPTCATVIPGAKDQMLIVAAEMKWLLGHAGPA